MHCFTCGGLGLKDGICPECGREPHSLNLQLMDKTEIETFMSQTESIAVPKEYCGILWDKDTLLSNHKDLQKDLTFNRFVSQLEKLHTFFADGKLPTKSAIIIAPPQFGKETFAFSCMQLALAKGFTVAPLLDTVELKRLLVLAAENPKYTLYNRISYDDYLTSDVVFITVTKTQYAKEAAPIIMEILGRRARMSLPTFFICRYRLNELAWSNKQEEFSSIIDRNDTENSLKYPVLLSYRKEF